MRKWVWVNKTTDNRGLQWRYTENEHTTVVWIPGTDHRDDWKHHGKIRLFQAADGIWVTRADLELARDIVRVVESIGKPVRIGGHSWGGAITALVTWILRRRGGLCYGFLFGTKRAGNDRFVESVKLWITSYRTRGDIVPFLPPWLAGFPTTVVGRIDWPWRAHQPSSYRQVIEESGFEL